MLLERPAPEANGSIYAEVFLVLVETSDLSRRTVPPGTQGALSAAIDALRRERAPAEVRRCVEAMAVAIHRLHWALLDPSPEGAIEAAARREEIANLRTEWLETTSPKHEA
jgi:hypothetical protein